MTTEGFRFYKDLATEEYIYAFPFHFSFESIASDPTSLSRNVAREQRVVTDA
jgi:hypothetical protein